MLRRVFVPLAVCTCVGVFVACPTPPGSPGGDEGEGEGEGEGEQGGDGDCPVVAGGNSICDVQDSNSDNAVATGALVTLPGVVATSAVFGSSFQNGNPTRFNLFIGDNPTKKRGGVFVSWLASANLPTDIAIGDVVTITGQVSEFTLEADQNPTETRIDATAIVKDGGNSPLVPLDVTEADLLGANGEDYEGVLVRLNGGLIASSDQFGFTLDGGLKVASAIFNYRGLIGETFTSITGVVRWDVFGGTGFELMPRQASDVVSLQRPTRTITELNDGTVTRCPGNANFNGCIANIEGIVTAPAFFISDENDGRGPRFGFFVGDPANVQNGRFGPNSGIFVFINPQDTVSAVTSTGYTFAQDAAAPGRPFLPGAAPEVGDIVEITGDNAENFGMRALRFTSSITKKGTGTVPLPALFGTGGLPVGDLKGGRPSFADDRQIAGIAGIDPSPNVEQWEAVLVELKDVATTTACYAQPFKSGTNAAFARDFGNWLVTGDVEIGTTFRLPQAFGGFFRNDGANTIADANKTCANLANKCQDSRVDGQTWTSLVGIVDFNFNVHRVSPRAQTDFNVSPGFVAPGTGNCP